MEPSRTTRRDFVADAGRLASLAALGACAAPSASASRPTLTPAPRTDSSGTWDLSWIPKVERATDRAVFDWPSLGDAADPLVLEIAERFLNNCAAAYGSQPYEARVVLNIRTTAIPAALTDETWDRFKLGAEYNAKDPTTQQLATRNPFLHRAPDPAPGISLPTLPDLMQKGSIVLVCDFALGHLSQRLATKMGRPADDVHRDLRAGFVPGAYAVPSGIFGLTRSQNSGCAFVRM
jgi:hypothetical protein